MLRLVEVATYLTNQLNAIGETHTPAYTFNIQAEVGANKNAADVKGIIKSAKAKLPPVLNGRNAVYNLLMELQITAPTTNFNLKNIEEILNSFVNQVNGQEIAFSQGKGLVTMTLGQAGSFKTEVGQGGMVSLSYDIDINYTENVATSRSKHWFLQIGKDTSNNPVYEEIAYTKESVLISKEGRTNKINSKKYSETFMLGQQKRYRFTFLYDENSLLCQMIQKDILDGDANKTYKLKYYDGITYTAETPYITTVSLFETGDTQSDKPNTAQFDITFADADDGQNTTRYYLALLDNPFDEATENTRCFEDTIDYYGNVTMTAKQNQYTWFQNLISSGGALEDQIPACNLSSVYLTNQTYVNSRKLDIMNLINKNYARIKIRQINNNNVTDTCYYYWTKNVQIGMNGQVTFDLEMDTFQSFMFQDGIKIDGNMIERASLNRWIDNGDGTISFDGNADSKLFERENLKNIAKRLKNRSKIIVKTDKTTNSRLDNWFENNVEAWLYICMSTGDYKTASSTGDNPPLTHAYNTHVRKDSNEPIQIDYAHATFCVPIMKIGAAPLYEKGVIRVYYGTGNAYHEINSNAFSSFLSANDGFSKIYSMKLSIKPPFDNKTWEENTNYEISADNKTLSIKTTNAMSGDTLDIGSNQRYWNISQPMGVGAGIIYMVNDDPTPNDAVIRTSSVLPTITFNKTDVCGIAANIPAKNIEFNPKLNGSDYKELQLNFGGSNDTYDIQKMNASKPNFKYYEELTSDTTKGLLRYTPSTDNGIFNTKYGESYNGFSYTNDLSLPMAVNQYNTYMANNKNAYLSFQNQQERQRASAQLGIVSGVVGGALSAVAGAATGGLSTALQSAGSSLGGQAGAGGVGGLTGGVFNYLKTLKDQEYQKTQFNLTIDDMKSAPNVMQNVNGNAVLQKAISGIKMYAEIYEALPHELNMANDDMFMNGFSYNKIDDLFKFINKTGSIHLRKNFNYLQAIIGNITGISMSSEIRNNLRQRILNGIRLWHTDTIDYDHENYEKWLKAPYDENYETYTNVTQYINKYVLYNDVLTKVTGTNYNNLGITAGTTIAYSNLA